MGDESRLAYSTVIAAVVVCAGVILLGCPWWAIPFGAACVLLAAAGAWWL